MRSIIAVCGSDGSDIHLSSYALKVAEDVGRFIAQRNGVLLCGGRSGIMQAACFGARQAGGVTIGILPESKQEANPYVDIGLISGLGSRRNTLVVGFSDVVIALAGRWGTLNELTYAFIIKKPVVLIRGTGGCVDALISGAFHINSQDHPYYIADSAFDAVEKAFALLKGR
ncbi:MAG: TIGR00725 family protein [Candidatus Thermoplasmatota archaeon]